MTLQCDQITRKRPSLLRQNFRQNTWKFQKLIVSLQRERRNRVEPRCAERWHLRDDEQFDLAAWFPSLAYSWSRVASFFIFWYNGVTVGLCYNERVLLLHCLCFV